jgi:hypothetical protein
MSHTHIVRRSITTLLAATFAVPVVAQDIRSFKGGVRIAAGTCTTFPVVAGATVTSTTGDLAISHPSQTVNVRVLCHLTVPEGAVIRRFAMTGKVPAGEIFAILATVDATDPGQAPFFSPLTMTPATPFDVPGKLQRVAADLPAAGSESLTISRLRPHYIEATVKTRAAVAGSDPMRLFFFEVYWN